jgi:hypothetical protein
MRDTSVASIAAAIKLSTIAWPSTISITMMKAVNGARVTAARNAAMPSAMSAGPRLGSMACAIAFPIPAPPMESEGAKMPPGTPHQADSQVATNFSNVAIGVSSACP